MRFFKEDEKGVSTMCRVMEGLYNEGVAEGKTEERLKNIKNLILSLGLTAEAAMDALKISKDEQSKYLALL